MRIVGAIGIRRAAAATCVLVAATMAVVGCRGAVDRTFFDDDVEGSPDGAVQDATTAQGDVVTTADDTGAPDADMPDAADGGDATGDGGDGGVVGDPRKVGGTVVALVGTGLVLTVNGGNDLAVGPPDAGGNVTFSFPQTFPEGTTVTVAIKTQPSSPSQTCAVSGGTAVLGSSDFTSVVVNCLKDSYTVGGSISGLEGSIVLENNGGDPISLTANGDFAFTTPLESGDDYDVSVASHSALPEQTCNLSNGMGKVGSANITNVSVTCTTNSYSVGGDVSGIPGGATLTLSNNGVPLVVPADGSFTFPTKVLSNRSYDVQVVTPPPNKTCIVENGSGTITTADVSNVVVTCVPRYALEENFDGVAAPALPADWTTAFLEKQGNPSPFYTTNSASGTLPASHSSPNSCTVENTNQVADIVLTSPSFTVSSSTAVLTFRHAFALEAASGASTVGYDGVVLEISINGGSFVDIVTAGGTFTAGGYNRTLAPTSSYQNPLGGRAAWSGSTGGNWMTTSVTLPLTAGTSAQIRFRQGTDKQNVVPPYIGWRVDSLVVAN